MYPWCVGGECVYVCVFLYSRILLWRIYERYYLFFPSHLQSNKEIFLIKFFMYT